MKKLLFLLPLVLIGCSQYKEKQPDGSIFGCDIIILDHCQYIFYHAGNQAGLAHKGNCTNSIHLYKQKLEND